MKTGPKTGDRRLNEPAKETTIYDVAQLAGVAISTVSLALRRDPRVTLDTRKLVLAAAKSLNFHPNISAQNLAQRQTNLVAVFGWFFPDSMTTNSFSSIQMLMGIQERLKSTDYAIYLVNWSTQPHEQCRVLQDAANRHFLRGAIWLTSTLVPEDIRLIRDSGLPVVCAEVSCKGLDNVVLDNALAGYLGSKHLLASGRRRLAIVTGPVKGQVQVNRLKGCRKAAKEFKILWSEIALYKANYSFQDGLQAAAEIGRAVKAGHGPDALFCIAGDRTALGLLTGLKQAGVRIPQDVALLGIDNMVETSYCEPPLSTIEQPLFQMGHQVADLLLNRIGQPKSKPRQVQLLPRLIQRASS